MSQGQTGGQQSSAQPEDFSSELTCTVAGYCQQLAANFQKKLQAAGIPFRVVTITPTPTAMRLGKPISIIALEGQLANQAIASGVGCHAATEAGKNIFDDSFPMGLPVTEWKTKFKVLVNQ